MDKNFFDFIYPIDYISKLSAICHITFDTKNLSKLWVTYSLLLVLLMNVLSMYQLHLDITDENNTKLFKFVSFLRLVSSALTKTSICIVFILKYKTIVRFLNCANYIEALIEKGLRGWLLKKCYVKLQLMIIFSVVSAVSLQILFTAKTTGFIPSFLHVFNFISWICQVQFICCVLLLNKYIILINSKLSQIKENSNSKRAQEISMYDYNRKFQNKPGLDEHNIEQVLYLCKELVRFINIAKEDLNSFFSYPILLIIADNLLLTTFSLYMLIKNMSLDLDSEEFFQQISYLYDVSLNVIQIICIAFPCANTDIAVKSTAVHTHQLINQKHIFQENSKILVLFSKQLLHVDMKYTACGFFTLNENLLTSVFAAISTQLVILLQFQMASTPTASTTSISPVSVATSDE